MFTRTRQHPFAKTLYETADKTMLIFEESTHTYRWNWVKVPSFTQILDDIGFINPWAKDKFGAQRGTACHVMLDLHWKGTLDISSIDPRLLAYYHQFKLFLKKYPGIEADIDTSGNIASECKIYVEKYGYAMTLDFCGWYKDKRILIDWKFWNSPHAAPALLDNVALQTIAYEIGYREKNNIPDYEPIERWAVHITPDKFRRIVLCDPRDKPAWISCVNVYKLKHRRDKADG